MKRVIKTWIAIALLGMLSITAAAQEERSKPAPWVSDKGYWVVESNINSPLNHTVWFYNNTGDMIYKESLTGVRLNPDKRKVKMKLKKVLETAVIAWQQHRVPDENKNYVAAVLKH
jgi:hypothetical protein